MPDSSKTEHARNRPCHTRLRPGSRGPSDDACHLCRILMGINELEALEALEAPGRFDDGRRCTAHWNRAQSASQRWFLPRRCNENMAQCKMHAGSPLFAAARREPANGDFGTGSIAAHLGPLRVERLKMLAAFCCQIALFAAYKSCWPVSSRQLHRGRVSSGAHGDPHHGAFTKVHTYTARTRETAIKSSGCRTLNLENPHHPVSSSLWPSSMLLLQVNQRVYQRERLAASSARQTRARHGQGTVRSQTGSSKQ